MRFLGQGLGPFRIDGEFGAVFYVEGVVGHRGQPPVGGPANSSPRYGSRFCLPVRQPNAASALRTSEVRDCAHLTVSNCVPFQTFLRFASA
jgi:hypothetical protein